MKRLADTLDALRLERGHEEKLSDFIEIFLKWNKRINLSAARSIAEVEEHVIDCLHVVPHLVGASRVVDVGSGGGFPVAIAAACLPAVSFTALEPVHKKHAFLRTAARELALANLAVFAARVEDRPDNDYDIATSRATFDLPDWLARGLRLVRPGGMVLGFEAVRREDLPADVERHRYDLGGKSRAIIAVRRPQPS